MKSKLLCMIYDAFYNLAPTCFSRPNLSPFFSVSSCFIQTKLWCSVVMPRVSTPWAFTDASKNSLFSPHYPWAPLHSRAWVTFPVTPVQFHLTIHLHYWSPKDTLLIIRFISLFFFKLLLFLCQTVHSSRVGRVLNKCVFVFQFWEHILTWIYLTNFFLNQMSLHWKSKWRQFPCWDSK